MREHLVVEDPLVRRQRIVESAVRQALVRLVVRADRRDQDAAASFVSFAIASHIHAPGRQSDDARLETQHLAHVGAERVVDEIERRLARAHVDEQTSEGADEGRQPRPAGLAELEQGGQNVARRIERGRTEHARA